MAENTVSVTSQDNDLKYSLTITQNGPDTAQFNVVDFDLNGGQELSSSSRCGRAKASTAGGGGALLSHTANDYITR